MKRNSKHISLLLWALTIRNTYIFRQLIMLYLSWPWLNLGIQPCVWARKPDWMPSQCQAGTSLASNSVSACKQRVGSQVSSKLGSWLGSQCQRIQGTPRLVQSSTSDHVRAGDAGRVWACWGWATVGVPVCWRGDGAFRDVLVAWSQANIFQLMNCLTSMSPARVWLG